MQITKKKEITKYCEWYLRNVKFPALSSEIVHYMLEHGHDGNRVSVRPEAFTMRMKMDPGTFVCVGRERKGLIWDLVERDSY